MKGQLCSDCGELLVLHRDRTCTVLARVHDGAPDRKGRSSARAADTKPEEDLRCFYCDVELIESRCRGGAQSNSATVDHLTPLARGGRRRDPKNLVVACHSCNCSKGSKTLGEYREYVSRREAGIPYLTSEAEAWLQRIGVRIEDHRDLVVFPGERQA